MHIILLNYCMGLTVPCYHMIPSLFTSSDHPGCINMSMILVFDNVPSSPYIGWKILAYFTEDAKPRPAKPPLNFGGRLTWVDFLKVHISMGWCKKDVTPLLTHWRYIFLALTHQYIMRRFWTTLLITARMPWYYARHNISILFYMAPWTDSLVICMHQGACFCHIWPLMMCTKHGMPYWEKYTEWNLISKAFLSIQIIGWNFRIHRGSKNAP